MAKLPQDEYVNSSYTTLFLIFTIFYSLFIAFAYTGREYSAAFALIGFAFIAYFVWDIIRQLFSPGQAVALYIGIFHVLPVLMALLLSIPVGWLALVIYLAATITAGIFEDLYENFIKKRVPKRFLKRLWSIDNKIDKSIAPLSVKYLQLTEFRGVVLATGLALLYFVAVLVLLHR